MGPDQNFSYIARVRPEVAFLIDIRRDNLLHHLLLKALMERSATRVEFPAALHGKPAPDDPGSWEERPLADIIAWVDDASASPDLRAMRETGAVLRELGLALSALYASNVEYYLWGDGASAAWVANVASLPAAANAVVIRSHFPDAGPAHPSAVPAYWATQTLQPVASLVAGGSASYWDVVTRDAAPLR